MKVIIEVSDEAIDNCIGELCDCIGVRLTPEQFINVWLRIHSPFSDLYDGGFGDTETKSMFANYFVRRILRQPSIPTYGDKDIDKEKYWKSVQDAAQAMGYEIAT